MYLLVYDCEACKIVSYLCALNLVWVITEFVYFVVNDLSPEPPGTEDSDKLLINMLFEVHTSPVMLKKSMRCNHYNINSVFNVSRLCLVKQKVALLYCL